jgi:hypothetical protein
MTIDFKTMQEMARAALDAKNLTAYCDYIANTIKHALPVTGVATSTVHSEPSSTTKTVEAEYLGKKYIVTVKEA